MKTLAMSISQKGSLKPELNRMLPGVSEPNAA